MLVLPQVIQCCDQPICKVHFKMPLTSDQNLILVFSFRITSFDLLLESVARSQLSDKTSKPVMQKHHMVAQRALFVCEDVGLGTADSVPL